MSNSRNNDNSNHDPTRFYLDDGLEGYTTSLENLIGAALQVQQRSRPLHLPSIQSLPPSNPPDPILNSHQSSMPVQSNNVPGVALYHGHTRDYGLGPAPGFTASHHYQNPPQDISTYTQTMYSFLGYPPSYIPALAVQHSERSTSAVGVTHRNDHRGSSAQRMHNCGNRRNSTGRVPSQVLHSEQTAQPTSSRAAPLPQSHRLIPLAPDVVTMAMTPPGQTVRSIPNNAGPPLNQYMPPPDSAEQHNNGSTPAVFGPAFDDLFDASFFQSSPASTTSTVPMNSGDYGTSSTTGVSSIRSFHPQGSYTTYRSSLAEHGGEDPVLTHAPVPTLSYPIPPQATRSFMQAMEVVAGAIEATGPSDRLAHLEAERAKLRAYLARHRADRPRSMPPRAEIRHFTTLPAAGASHDQECPICQEPYDDQKHTAVRLKNVVCDHVFGLPCLQEWVNSRMQNAHRCPACRQNLRGALSMVVPDPRGQANTASGGASRVSSGSHTQYESYLETLRRQTGVTGSRRNMVEQFHAESEAQRQYMRSLRADLEPPLAQGEAPDHLEDILSRQELRQVLPSLDDPEQAATYRPAVSLPTGMSSRDVEQQLADMEARWRAPRAATPAPPPAASITWDGQSERARRQARVVAADRARLETLARQVAPGTALHNFMDELTSGNRGGGQHMGNERQLMSRRREDFMRQNRQLSRQNQAREQEEEQLRR
jgi:hypothetical protein